MQTTTEIKLVLDSETEQKIQEIIQRDSRVIQRVLGILQNEENTIYTRTKSGKYRTSRKILAEFMVSTKNHTSPKYDLKEQFINISHNELMECIDNANEMYLGYLQRKAKDSRTSHPHLQTTRSRRIGYRRFNINLDTATLDTIYSCKTNLVIARGEKSRVIHDRIEMDFVPNRRLHEFLEQGKAKSIEIIQKKGRYFAHVTIKIDTPDYTPPEDSELGVIGVDLGIAKTATAILYAKGEIRDTLVLNNSHSKNAYIEAETRISQLQRLEKLRSSRRNRKFFHIMAGKCGSGTLSQYLLSLNSYLKEGSITTEMIDRGLRLAQKEGADPKYQDRIIEKLQQLRDTIAEGLLDKTSGLHNYLDRLKSTRADIKDDMIKQLCAELQAFIENHRDNYNLYVVVGKPNGIQYRHRRGSGNKWLRKRINRWAFHAFQTQLGHNMAKIGMEKRLIEVSEAWTSKLCYRCNKKGVRPRQDTFHCSNYHCLEKINADCNGAANIAKRGIVYWKLIKKADYPDWNIKLKKSKKTKKSTKSRRKKNQSKKSGDLLQSSLDKYLRSPAGIAD